MGSTVGGFDERMNEGAASLQVQLFTEIIIDRVLNIWGVITHEGGDRLDSFRL
ncbi:MAG: hypothetical protein HC778_07795 [Chamaesiphon sp. CSU_1_12]|nr:hypothetical protein [Chamaesiphon sp. CSU_1_12]